MVNSSRHSWAEEIKLSIHWHRKKGFHFLGNITASCSMFYIWTALQMVYHLHTFPPPLRYDTLTSNYTAWTDHLKMLKGTLRKFLFKREGRYSWELKMLYRSWLIHCGTLSGKNKTSLEWPEKGSPHFISHVTLSCSEHINGQLQNWSIIMGQTSLIVDSQL